MADLRLDRHIYLLMASVLVVAVGLSGCRSGNDAMEDHPTPADSIQALKVQGTTSPETGICLPYQVQSVDSNGNPSTIGFDAAVQMSAGVAQGVLIFTDSNCATTPVTQITIPSGQSQASFYVKDNLIETFKIQAQFSGTSVLSASLTSQFLENQIDVFLGGILGQSLYMGQGELGLLAFSQKFGGLSDITTDGTSLYVLDPGACLVRQVSMTNGSISLFAGGGVGGNGDCGYSDGVGEAAVFWQPTGIATDGTNLYVADLGAGILRKVVISSATVSLLAGNGPNCSFADGTGGSAGFGGGPNGVTVAGGQLFVTDGPINSICTATGCSIRQVDPTTGSTTTLAGTNGSCGSANGIGAAAQFNGPTGITNDGTNLYVADANGCMIRKINIATKAVSTLAGSTTCGYADGTGAAAKFNGADGMSTDGTSIFVTDTNNFVIRKIVISSGVVTTVAGAAGVGGSMNGTGAAASFWSPSGITSDGTDFYIADGLTVRKMVEASFAVSTFAGSSDVGELNGTQLQGGQVGSIGGMTSPDGQTIYMTDGSSIRKVSLADGSVSAFAGNAFVVGTADGTGSAAKFNLPIGITNDGTNLYIADSASCTIREAVIATGAVTTLAGNPGVCGNVDASGASAAFNSPSYVATDGTNLYVTDFWNNTIRQVVISTGAVTTIAGTGSAGSSDGTGTGASFNGPTGIVYVSDFLYVTDNNNYTVRQIQLSNAAVTTFAGTVGSWGASDGIGVLASFGNVEGLATDGTNLFVADIYNGAIRKIVISTATVSTVTSWTANTVSYQDGPLSNSALEPTNVLMLPSGLFFTDGGTFTPWGNYLNQSDLRWIH